MGANSDSEVIGKMIIGFIFYIMGITWSVLGIFWIGNYLVVGLPLWIAGTVLMVAPFKKHNDDHFLFVKKSL